MRTVEETLTELFGMIPVRQFTTAANAVKTTPEPSYYFGDAKEANKLILKFDTKVYPLIYQTSADEVQTDKWTEANLELVIATRNQKTDMYNHERWATSYRNVLLPLVEDIKTCFEKSGVIIPGATSDGSPSGFSYDISKRPNYSETESKEKNKFTDIVDALILRVRIRITPGCIEHNIKFNRPT